MIDLPDFTAVRRDNRAAQRQTDAQTAAAAVRLSLHGIKQIFFVCVPMIIGPAIATQVINRMGVEMEVSGTVGMVPGPSLFLVSAVLTLFTLIPLAAAGKMNRQRLQGQIR